MAVEKNLATLEKLTVEYVPTDSVQPNEYNNNRQDPHHFDLLLRSMRTDGFTQPIVVLRESNQIVDGEHRWLAANELGITEVPVVFVDMTPEQARIATLRHNRARGEEDYLMAAAVLRDLERLGAVDWAVDELKLDQVELDAMLREVAFLDETESIGSSEDGATVDSALSAAALQAQRELEAKLASGQTEADWAQSQQEAAGMFRLELSFHGEEATLVKQALGRRPAEALITILSEWSRG